MSDEIRAVAAMVRWATELLAGAWATMVYPRLAGHYLALLAGGVFVQRGKRTGHYWTEVLAPRRARFLIVDVTATQFGEREPRIRITRIESAAARRYRPIAYGEEAAACATGAPPRPSDLRDRWWHEIAGGGETAKSIHDDPPDLVYARTR